MEFPLIPKSLYILIDARHAIDSRQLDSFHSCFNLMYVRNNCCHSFPHGNSFSPVPTLLKSSFNPYRNGCSAFWLMLGQLLGLYAWLSWIFHFNVHRRFGKMASIRDLGCSRVQTMTTTFPFISAWFFFILIDLWLYFITPHHGFHVCIISKLIPNVSAHFWCFASSFLVCIDLYQL